MPTPTFPEPPRNGEDSFDDDLLDDDDITIIELGDLRDLDTGDEEFVELERGTGSLEAFVGGHVRPADVVRLSDLDREAVRVFAREWPDLPPETREAILRAIHELTDTQFGLRFERVFRVAVEDPEPTVRQLAVSGLWDDDAEEDVGRLLMSLVRDDPSIDVRTEAARALSTFTELAEIEEIDADLGEVIREELFRVAEDDAEPDMLRRAALESVATAGGDRVAALIRDALEIDDIDWKASALFAMGRTCRAEWLPYVLEELASPEAQLRFGAARACAGIADPAAVSELMEAMDGEEDLEVRHAIIAALGEIGTKSSLRALRTLARMAMPEDEDAFLDAIEMASILSEDPGTDDR